MASPVSNEEEEGGLGDFVLQGGNTLLQGGYNTSSKLLTSSLCRYETCIDIILFRTFMYSNTAVLIPLKPPSPAIMIGFGDFPFQADHPHFKYALLYLQAKQRL